MEEEAKRRLSASQLCGSPSRPPPRMSPRPFPSLSFLSYLQLARPATKRRSLTTTKLLRLLVGALPPGKAAAVLHYTDVNTVAALHEGLHCVLVGHGLRRESGTVSCILLFKPADTAAVSEYFEELKRRTEAPFL